MDPTRLRSQLLERFQAVRLFTRALCQPLAVEDYVVQSMPDASPTKWHLAHVTWFFETFLLDKLPGYQAPIQEYRYLFNSYYNGVGARFTRSKRGVISRPTVAETFRYFEHTDQHVIHFLNTAAEDLFLQLAPILELGLHHEQQHQELILTDIKHVLAQNPLHPAYRPAEPPPVLPVPALRWVDFPGGLHRIGRAGESFAYDNEGPRHVQYLRPFALGSRLVTNGEYLAFVADGGYERPELWLSAGWHEVQESGWRAPLYWEPLNGAWSVQSLAGFHPLNASEPVCHVSYYEADAYARWAGARLPLEAEWETAARAVSSTGNFADQGVYHPVPLQQDAPGGLVQIFGDVWEWSQSPYTPYPGYKPVPGPLGEYNGKFMCNQFVLRGGSCTTPASHIRSTYRNFFPPATRWQFSGIRLAKDV